ncbi:MAG: NAD(P)-binding domain-containing protein [Candidatus Aenigmarchaeota archaeon]|nr:NAD(P)-binding domain-containing protein [Candidatus Aenigmarchaeota archaeon]
MGDKILFYLDAGSYSNPYDCLLAYDNGYNKVMPYFNVDKKKALKILHDVIFARNKRDIKNTVFFIGGSDVKKAEECYNTLKEFLLTSKVHPISLIFDPNGVYTTIAAMLINMKKQIKNLEGKNILILGGTGAIGQCIALILAEKKAVVTITSRNRDKINDILAQLNNPNIVGLICQCEYDVYTSCKNKEIILVAGPPGVTMIKKETISKITPLLLYDVSAIKPLGIENFNKREDFEELKKRAVCVNGEEIGTLKNKIERKILKNVLEKTMFYGKEEILTFATQENY